MTSTPDKKHYVGVPKMKCLCPATHGSKDGRCYVRTTGNFCDKCNERVVYILKKYTVTERYGVQVAAAHGDEVDANDEAAVSQPV